MKTQLLSFLLLSMVILQHAQAQSHMATTAINGTYQLMEAERSAKGPTKQKLMEYGEVNGQKMLAASACKQGCVPAVYSYQEELSQQFGKPVFFNSYGIYMITYDDDSFISCAPGTPLGEKPWQSFSYINFYSKDASKVGEMSRQKAIDFAIEVSNKMAGE